MFRPLSTKEVVAVLQREGFVFISQRGSHGKYKNRRTGAMAIVPMGKREIPPGTLRSLVRQSRIAAEDFFGA